MFPANAVLPVPLALPVFGSKTQPARGVTLQFVPAGITAERFAFPRLSKIPAGLGTVTVRVASSRRLVASQSVKKKSLFFNIGPPTANPYWLSIDFGFR